MLINDRRLRIYGQVSFTIIFFLFFNAFMFFYESNGYLLLGVKSLLVSVFFAVSLWEPARWLILKTRKKWNGVENNLKRKLALAAILIPYSIFIGLFRTFIENWLLWDLPWKEMSFIIPMLGITLLFLLVEVALYESLFFIEEWHKSVLEAKELKKVNLEMQFDSLKVQIQPHFLFNTLNTLIGLMKIDTPRAIKFTEEMAHVYRYLLEANDRQLISLHEEMKFSKAYFFLLKTRYSEGLHLDITDEQDMDNYQLPPLTLQILIENAVKHNIITSKMPLYITIKFQAVLKQLVISNNLQRKPQMFHSGLGLIHLKKKFELMRIPGVRIREGEGTFSVTIPLIKSNGYASSNY